MPGHHHHSVNRAIYFMRHINFSTNLRWCKYADILEDVSLLAAAGGRGVAVHLDDLQNCHDDEVILRKMNTAPLLATYLDADCSRS